MSAVNFTCPVDDTAAHTTGTGTSQEEADGSGCTASITISEPRFMDESKGSSEEIARLKAEIKRLQNVVRRMSTVDVRTGKGVVRAPAIAAILEQGMSSDAGLFDSDEEADREELIRLTLENTDLKRDVEHMRGEIASLKELCETKHGTSAALSPAEVQEIEEHIAERLLHDIEKNNNPRELKIPLLLVKQNEVILQLKKQLADSTSSPQQSTTICTACQGKAAEAASVSTSGNKTDDIQVAEPVAETTTRSRSIIDEALKVDAIVNGAKLTSTGLAIV